jgi:hypothetical protein
VFEVFLETASRRTRGIAVVFQWPVGLWLGTWKRRDAGSKATTRRQALRIGRVKFVKVFQAAGSWNKAVFDTCGL